MDYLIALVLISLSALFSGLTLGLFTFDPHTLKRRAELGDTQAAKIYPLRQRGNLLLTTLLLGNVTVNTALAVYLGTLFESVAAGFIATAVIFVFGEITPQAIFSRHAMRLCALASPLVRLAIFVFYPVAWPISYILDMVLGNELPRMYSKNELMHIISEHEESEHSPIDADEERILHGALKFSHRKVSEVMTPLDAVAMFDCEQRLTRAFIEEAANLGYSRYPIYQKRRANIIGILYTKDLLVEDEDIAVKDTEAAFERRFLKVRAHQLLDEVLSRMLKQKRHLAVVYTTEDACVGVITLEDIIEEIIQYEIQDEDDIGAGKEIVTPPLASSL